jgi:hypothetical protein
MTAIVASVTHQIRVATTSQPTHRDSIQSSSFWHVAAARATRGAAWRTRISRTPCDRSNGDDNGSNTTLGCVVRNMLDVSSLSEGKFH